MSDNSNERYYRIGCNIYDRTKGAEWNVCCTSYKHALRATEALNRPPSGSVSDHGELVSWLRREAQFWRLANPAAKRGEALDSARCEDRANKIDEAATAIRNIQKPSEFYCQKCGGMLNEFSKCGKCLSTKPDTSNASDLASVPLLDWLDDGDRGEKGFTGYNLKFDEAFRIKDALSALPSTATSSDASELVKEILAETEHWDVMPECREKGDLELVIGLLKRCLPLLPSNERVSKKEAQLLVGALQEFHVLSDLGGDIEDHEVGEI